LRCGFTRRKKKNCEDESQGGEVKKVVAYEKQHPTPEKKV